MRRNRRGQNGNAGRRFENTAGKSGGTARKSNAYVPDVRPFMRQYGYGEGLEDILREIGMLPEKNTFYYDSGDLWRSGKKQ